MRFPKVLTALWVTALTIALTVAGSVLTSTQAAAWTNSTCTVYFFNRCTTGSIPANSSGHYVKIQIDAADPSPVDLEWKVVDANNGVAVGRGRLAPGCTLRKQINGLYSRYYVRVDLAAPITWVNIHNNTTTWPDHEVTC